ncbi:MAG: TetR/AcrR family transcriptional regulator [Thermoanaerobaculaceae bacterium]|nr:TetR/AcrR family transcriptional regulator [Thermoanaerobaculaceae bacterium]TAM56974.1 MAG: TetR/AcrR family transcriptional regulator [Acidobacteriota bacterium]
MNQAEKSQRSRERILEAALQLFSSQGYRATSVRDIAAGAGVSTGNVYHHFPDKETIYLTLLDQYWEAIDDPDLPFNRALATGTFPDNLEEVGHASRELVRVYRRHVALIYVDVVEFEGSHIRKFYAEMAERYAKFMATHDGAKALAARLRPGISPASAAMFATRFYINYFAVEILFGVPNHFGKDSEAVVRETAEILRHGMLRPDA